MSYRSIYLFVEGPDDKRFVERIVKPLLEKVYSSVPIYDYSGWPESLAEVAAIKETEITNSP